MANALTKAVLDKNAELDAITAYAGNTAKIKIYSGSVPANADASLGAATLLATLTGASPFAAGASGGVLTVGAISSDTNAAASGTASFFRLYKTDGTTAVLQGTVGTSGCDLNLNSTAITSGGTVAISSWTITSGN